MIHQTVEYARGLHTLGIHVKAYGEGNEAAYSLSPTMCWHETPICGDTTTFAQVLI